jgi:hypothetical protein
MSPALKVRRRKGNTGLWISRSAEFRKIADENAGIAEFQSQRSQRTMVMMTCCINLLQTANDLG